MGLLSSDWERLEAPKYINHMKIIQSLVPQCVSSAKIVNQLSVVLAPKDKIWVSQGPLWRFKQVTANHGEMAVLMGCSKALSNLSYVFFTPWRFGNCQLWDTKIYNRMQTESPHLSNSDEVARDCMLPGLGPHIWKLEKTRHHDHIILCESSTWKIYSILAFLQITHPQYSEGVLWGNKSRLLWRTRDIV